MDEIALNDLKNALDGLLSINTTITRVPIRGHSDIYTYELTIDLQVDGRTVNSNTITLPGYGEDDEDKEDQS